MQQGRGHGLPSTMSSEDSPELIDEAPNLQKLDVVNLANLSLEVMKSSINPASQKPPTSCPSYSAKNMSSNKFQ